jgi:Tol biopolymer transport system component/C-terminal processing protease CtpA/Prc
MVRLVCFFAALAAAAAEPRISFTEPSISPDAAEIAFVSGGDIWTAPARGGEARLLLSHPANESRPLYSPDGKRIAFGSNRTGNGDVYVLTLATGEVKRLTWDDANESVEGWSRDGRWIYFSSSARDISGMPDIYRVAVEGGTPMLVTADRYVSEYYAAPAPDGKTLAFCARGMAAGQWWRKGHSHIDESEIWLRHEGSPARYEQVSPRGARQGWPMWSRDGRVLYYVSDRSGAANLWRQPMGGKAQQVTRFSDGRVLWAAISADGRAIVFERDFRIWKLETESGKAAPVEIVRKGAPSAPGVQHLSLGGQFQEMSVSPDGKKIALAARGEVFAASAKDGGEALRLTRTSAPESQLAWAPDSRKLAYVSTRSGAAQVWQYDFPSGKETQLTSGGEDAAPRYSFDGKSLAFVRDGKELRVLDIAAKQERTVATGYLDRAPILSDRPFAWSPDNKWLAFFNVSGKGFTNAYVIPAAGGEPARAVSYLSNTSSDSMIWSPDGKYLLMTTGQRTEDGHMARVDLIPRTPRFREDRFRELFRDDAPKPVASPLPTSLAADAKPAKSATAPDVKIVFDGVRRRLSLLPTGLDVDSAAISPDGKWLAMVASAAGQQNLYAWSLDELAKEPPVARQLTSTSGRKRSIAWSADSKEVFYLERGAVASVAVESRQSKPLAVSAEMDVDFASEKVAVFTQAWSWLRDHFYDPQFHGVDWAGVRKEYGPLIEGAATPDEMRRLLNLMVGELNASHLGAGAPMTSAVTATGRLGLRFDRETYEASGKLKVSEVIPLGPAAIAGVKAGETLDAVDGVTVDGRANLDALLDYRIGKRVALTVSGKQVPVLPVNLATEKALVYQQWVDRNREYVAKVSGGRLGYVHMIDMGQASLDRLYLDLDAENHGREGVVVDIRNNNGGFVNAYALDVFARRPYLKMTTRGRQEAPARTMLGQRSLERPTILVVNQHSLSDAEDFTEGYRALKLGKVVGEPTAGWIIYTWGESLLDGTQFRLPRTRIRGAAGDDMELHPRPVDVPATRPVGETYTEKDTQLDAAVKELLGQLGVLR